jgi:hypothetical protein
VLLFLRLVSPRRTLTSVAMWHHRLQNLFSVNIETFNQDYYLFTEKNKGINYLDIFQGFSHYRILIICHLKADELMAFLKGEK